MKKDKEKNEISRGFWTFFIIFVTLRFIVHLLIEYID